MRGGEEGYFARIESDDSRSACISRNRSLNQWSYISIGLIETFMYNLNDSYLKCLSVLSHFIQLKVKWSRTCATHKHKPVTGVSSALAHSAV